MEINRSKVDKDMSSAIERRWFLPIFIVIGVSCVFFMSGRFGQPVSAEEELYSAVKNGIVVVPIQIARDSYGIAMVDKDAETMWIYELNSRGPAHSRLRLLAARSWRYDTLLQEFNTAEPTPEQIKALLEGRLQGNEKQQGENILEIAEPNGSNLGIK